jgi:hypothetical protein
MSDAAGTQSFYFGLPDRPLFGVFHPSAVESTQAQPLPAVLLLSAWGAEDLSAHRSWCELAQRISNEGHACLRFDLDACGDSYDPAPEDDLWPLWRVSALHAIALLRERARTQDVIVVGMRLGALLAADLVAVLATESAPVSAPVAAAVSAPVSPPLSAPIPVSDAIVEIGAQRVTLAGLVLLAPVRTGKAYLRELRLLAQALAQGEAAPGTAFAAGFALNAATTRSVDGLKLPAAVRCPCVAVIDRDDFGIGEGWVASQRERGLHTHYAVKPGFGDMVLTAHLAKAATAMFDELMRVLDEFSRHSHALNARKAPEDATLRPDRRKVSRPPPLGFHTQSSVRVWVDSRNAHGFVRESIAPVFGPMNIASIQVEPLLGQARTGKGLLILNSSTERRIGPNRMWVGFARERAALGDVVIRLDMPGLGESFPAYHNEPNAVYPKLVIAHVQAFLTNLSEQGLATRWSVLGLCSGGYHAFRLGVADPRIAEVFAVNTFGLVPAEVENFEERANRVQQQLVAESAARNVWSRERWLKVLRGQVNVGLILRSVAGRLVKKLAGKALRYGVKLHLLPPPVVAKDLRQLVNRGCGMHFVFATTDPGPVILRESTADEVVGMIARGEVTEDMIKKADHTFAGLVARPTLFARLHERMNATNSKV